MTFFDEPEILKAPPIKRAAYSDRMAWLLAEFSRLAYRELPEEKCANHLLPKIKELVNENRWIEEGKPMVLSIIEKTSREKSRVEHILEENNIRFVDSFVNEGTEALLAEVSNGGESFLVLSFRGTSSAKDFLTNSRANLQKIEGGGKAHRGFHKGLHAILADVRKALLKEGKNKPLYLTGHSLGGAWALLATRYLQDFNVSATYTYGCPRAANDEFFSRVKSPVYRIVHRADAVTRVPFGYGLRIILNTIRLIPLNGTKKISEFLRRLFVGYTHFGHLVYICGELKTEEKPSSIQVRLSPNIFIVLEDFYKQIANSIGNAFEDHDISTYSDKLAQKARERNLP